MHLKELITKLQVYMCIELSMVYICELYRQIFQWLATTLASQLETSKYELKKVQPNCQGVKVRNHNHVKGLIHVCIVCRGLTFFLIEANVKMLTRQTDGQTDIINS